MSVQKFDHNQKARLSHEPIPYLQLSKEVVQKITNPIAGYIWVYLSSMPPDWIVIKQQVKNHFQLGNGKVKSAFSYLSDHNLIEYNPVKDPETNRFLYWDIRVLNGCAFTQCTNVQCCANPEMHKEKVNKINDGSHRVNFPPTGKWEATNKIIKNKENIKTKNICASDDARAQNFDREFDLFWKAYPVKKNKRRTKKLWDKIVKTEPQAGNIILDVQRRVLHDYSWKDVQFVPHPSTYLNGERWEDEIVNPSKRIAAYEKTSPRAPNAAKSHIPESRSTVREWAPGNPDYDRVNGVSRNGGTRNTGATKA